MDDIARPLLPGALDASRTALVLIDLQKGIAARETQPHAAGDVVARAKILADRFRAAKAPVFLVHVGWSPGFGDYPRQPVAEAMSLPPGGFPPEFTDFVDGLRQPGDHVILKRQWSAFHGTELDLQLRRRGIDTVVLGGIATNIGVESTARQAWEHGYRLILVEDACATFAADMHKFAFDRIFPRLGTIAKALDIAFASDKSTNTR